MICGWDSAPRNQNLNISAEQKWKTHRTSGKSLKSEVWDLEKIIIVEPTFDYISLMNNLHENYLHNLKKHI